MNQRPLQGSARWRNYPLVGASLLIVLTLVGVPIVASAAELIYANGLVRTEYQRAQSGTGTVSGGKGYATGNRIYIVVETVEAVRGVRLYYGSAFGGPVSFTHGSQGNTRSQCFWYAQRGATPGTTAAVSCWRRTP